MTITECVGPMPLIALSFSFQADVIAVVYKVVVVGGGNVVGGLDTKNICHLRNVQFYIKIKKLFYFKTLL